MIIVSSREGGTNPSKKSDGLLLRREKVSDRREYSDNQEDFIPITEDQSALDQCLQGNGENAGGGSKEVLILIHGYNNKQNDIYRAYIQIEEKIKHKYSCVIGYVWPGGDHALHWWDAKGKAGRVAGQFSELLDLLKAKGCTVDVMTHSLGAKVCLQALKSKSASGKNGNTELVRYCFCTAAAIHSECFNKDGIPLPPVAPHLQESMEYERTLEKKRLEAYEYDEAVDLCRKLIVFHSIEDEALSRLYPLAEGYTAMGYAGPKIRDKGKIDRGRICIVDCTQVVTQHGGYKRAQKVFAYIEKVIDDGTCQFEQVLQ